MEIAIVLRQFHVQIRQHGHHRCVAAVQCPDQKAHNEDQVQLHTLPTALAHPQIGALW